MTPLSLALIAIGGFNSYLLAIRNPFEGAADALPFQLLLTVGVLLLGTIATSAWLSSLGPALAALWFLFPLISAAISLQPYLALAKFLHSAELYDRPLDVVGEWHDRPHWADLGEQAVFGIFYAQAAVIVGGGLGLVLLRKTVSNERF